MTTNAFATIGSLVGDPARANMLLALMDGRALTASELARIAGVTPQTASGHLKRLSSGGLLGVVRQGRHRYHRLAHPDVARMLETILQVTAGVAQPGRAVVPGPRDEAMRRARTCYDHLAGRLGVAIADALVDAGSVLLSPDGGSVTPSGQRFFAQLGLDVQTFGTVATGRARSVLCRPCLDWSERRDHLAGRVGAALCQHCLERGWIRRFEGARAVTITRDGERAFRSHFDIRTDSL